MSRIAQLPEHQADIISQGALAAMLKLLQRGISTPHTDAWTPQASAFDSPHVLVVLQM